MNVHQQFRGAHAARVLVSPSRRNGLRSDATLKQEVEIKTKVRDREDALANTRAACAPRNT
jgi:hypothetical protein